jgi:hypothetical protein
MFHSGALGCVAFQRDGDGETAVGDNGFFEVIGSRFGLFTLAIVFLSATLALLPTATSAAQMTWQYSRYLDQDPFKTRLTLYYGVPETDRVQAVVKCHIGNSGTYATLDVSAPVGSLAANTAVQVQFTGRGFSQVVDASVIRAREVGIDGVSIALQLGDPLWQAIRAMSELRYNVTGFTARRLPLGGSNGPAGRFLRDCREMPRPGQVSGPATPPQTDDPRWATCDVYRAERSRNSDVPITVTFRNRSGAYRGVMWIDFNGRPVQYANLNPGETYTINTYMTHPWMFTDGPGNCIEMFMPQPGVSSFDVTAPNRNFGPE